MAEAKPSLLEGCNLRCRLRLRGILAIQANVGGFRSLGLAVFRASHLALLQLAGFLAPTIIAPLGHPDLPGRIGNALTLRNQNVNFAQFRGNLFGLVLFPRLVCSGGDPRWYSRDDPSG
jgi:hypothetical protein